MAVLCTQAIRDEVLKLEQELCMREWHEQQRAIEDGHDEMALHAPAGLRIEDRKLQYSNGDHYQGEVLHDLRHGHGKHTCSNGDVYKGAWNFDKRHGQGRATFASGLSYEGQWREDMAHGSGKATYQNGGCYEGDFRNDHRWGWGKHTFPDGSIYEGEWFDDIIEGRGRFSYVDGSYYEGEVGNGKRVRGQWCSADGSTEYEGCWRNDLQHGWGIMSQRGEWKYTGDWQAGQQCGQGVCEYVGGIVYQGAWKDGSRHGVGTLKGPTYEYEGEWENDRQHGQGKCQLESGDKYKGVWDSGQRHGEGSCIFVNGDKYKGQWVKGQRSGPGACEFANGDLYQGGWSDDKRHGSGTCRFADGTKFRGPWHSDGWVQSAACPAGSHALLSPQDALQAVAGEPTSFVIQAQDDLGNKRLTGGDEFTVEVRGPSSTWASLEDHKDGHYTATFSATSAGDHLIHVFLGGEPVAGSPHLACITAAAPSARHSTTLGDGSHVARVGNTCHFTTEVRDRFGNRCCDEAALHKFGMEVDLSCNGMQCDVAVTPDAASGELRCSYTAAAPGRWRLSLTSHGVHLRDSPFSVKVTQSQRDADLAATASDAPTTKGPTSQTTELSADGERPKRDDPEGIALDRVPVDESRLWSALAEAAYCGDGATDGWESDDEGPPPSNDDMYIKAHPGVPVVENLEDLWMVSKLQRQRKETEAAQKQARLAKMKAALQQQLGDPVEAPRPVGIDAAGNLITAMPQPPSNSDDSATTLVPMPLTLPLEPIENSGPGIQCT